MTVYSDKIRRVILKNTRTPSTTLIIVSLILFFLYPALSFSTDYYVDGKTGNDTNDGTAPTPWKTIGHAISTAVNTDTIYIRYATYRESLELKSAEMSSLQIKGISQDGNMPIIDATGEPRAFDVKDFNGTIQGLEIIGAGIHGVNIAGESNNAQIIGCRIHNNKKGVHVADTSTPLISGNLIYSNSQCGIGIMGASSPTINGNHIYQNGNGSPAGPSAGICIPGNSSPRIYNNIIRNNYNSGLNILDNAAPVIVNNTIAHHRGSQNSLGTAIKIIQNIGIEFVKVSNNIIIDNDIGLFSTAKNPVTGNDHNDLWKNDTDYFGFTADSHDIYTDPVLAVDYSPSRNSPCINAGSRTGAPAADIRGIFRPQGKGFDIGAYECIENQGVTSETSGHQSILNSFLFLLLQ